MQAEIRRADGQTVNSQLPCSSSCSEMEAEAANTIAKITLARGKYPKEIEDRQAGASALNQISDSQEDSSEEFNRSG